MDDPSPQLPPPSSDDRTPVYEPPVLLRLGSLTDLTRGVNPTSTDGVSPGSAV